VTKAGDSLTSIADEVYGDDTRWSELYEANRKAIGDDSNLIQVGVTLTIPDDGVAGDTLWSVAERFYGDGSRWPELHEANRDAIGDDPDKLGAGLTLTVSA
jgi:nucleoid-associated protein YgaU